MLSLDMEKIVKKIEKIPTLPVIAMQVIQLANDPKTGAGDLNKIISQDPSLSVKALKMVNSSYYGLSGKISSVKQAIVLLGFETVKSVALSTAVMDKFIQSEEKTRFDREKFWLHCLGVGVGARLLAKRSGKSLEIMENYFISGLLHDIGKIVLDQYFHNELKQILEGVSKRGISFYDAEIIVMGITHSDIGGWLAENWKLPQNLIESIRFHHEPPASGEFMHQVIAVHFADILCKSKGIGFSGDNFINNIDEAAVKKLGISDEMIENIIQNELDQELENASKLINLVKE